MAERRMFSKSVVCSDLFLDMPATTQNLYFQLGMNADDDGFVDSPKTIARMIGAGQDDLQLLSEKEYILPFKSGVIVLKHWRISNYIQKDRYHPTQYEKELAELEVSKTKAYALKNHLDTECIQDVSKMDTEVRLGKESINNIYAHSGEVRAGAISSSQTKKGAQKELPPYFDTFWKTYPRKKDKPKAIRAWRRLKVNETLLQMILTAIEREKKSSDWQKENGQFIPYPATWLNGRRWEDEEPTAQKKAVPACWREI